MQKILPVFIILSLCACTNNSTPSANIPIDIQTPTSSSKKNNRLELHLPEKSAYRGIINYQSGEIQIDKIQNKTNYITYCTSPDGCSITYANGKYFLQKDEKGNYIQTVCDKSSCQINTQYNDPILTQSPDAQHPHGTITFSLSKLENGEAIITDIHNNIPQHNSTTHHIVLGSQKFNTPLKFSDFGYWNIDLQTDTIYEKDDAFVFTAGDNTYEIDTSKQPIETKLNFSGNAIASVAGQILSGTSNLTFNPYSNNQENINLNFSKSNWYNVFVKGDASDLFFEGETSLGSKYAINTAPTSATNVVTKYYGENIPTEVVGTINVTDVQMQNGETIDINFSFGATK